MTLPLRNVASKSKKQNNIKEKEDIQPERLEGQQFKKLNRKYHHELMYLQSINSEHLPQNPFTG
jgi:hypothetical protein